MEASAAVSMGMTLLACTGVAVRILLRPFCVWFMVPGVPGGRFRPTVIALFLVLSELVLNGAPLRYP